MDILGRTPVGALGRFPLAPTGKIRGRISQKLSGESPGTPVKKILVDITEGRSIRVPKDFLLRILKKYPGVP